MSKWSESRDHGELISRAVIVSEFHPDADLLEYIAAQSRADDGRRVS